MISRCDTSHRQPESKHGVTFPIRISYIIVITMLYMIYVQRNI